LLFGFGVVGVVGFGVVALPVLTDIPVLAVLLEPLIWITFPVAVVVVQSPGPALTHLCPLGSVALMGIFNTYEYDSGSVGWHSPA